MRRLTGAGSDAVLPLVGGPPQEATVVGAGPHATYLEVGDAPGELLALVTRHAVRVPCAVVLPEDVELPAELVAGAHVRVGGREIVWDGGVLSVVRWWPAAAVTGATGLPPAPPVDPDAGLAARAATLRLAVGRHLVPDAVPPALDEAVDHLVRGDAAAVADHLRPVLGAGAGLTPSADDAVAGLLLTARSWYGSDIAPVISRVGALLRPELSRRTTAVSAGLLRHAAEGRGAPDVVRAVEHLTGRHTVDEQDVLRRLVQLGHSSGRDTGRGVLAFLDARLGRPSARPPDRRPWAHRDVRPSLPQPDRPARETA
jgi:hypothetical protein